jgi:ABC-type sugar transport system ATPase subunit
MTTTAQPIAVPIAQSPRGGMRDRLRDLLPRLVLAPSFLLILFFVYGFNLWTLLLSFTNSKAFTNVEPAGPDTYVVTRAAGKELTARMRAETPVRIGQNHTFALNLVYVTHDQIEAMTLDQDCGAEGRGTAAGRLSSRDLQHPQQSVRRRLHGIAGDEPA